MAIKQLVLATLFCVPALTTFAQEPNPEGTWRDEYGTIFQISLCGDGTGLCAKLIDVQGKSRTEENLAYVNQQVLQADQTAEAEWKGTVIYNGSEAGATINQNGPDTLSITGCRMILCQTLVFNRM